MRHAVPRPALSTASRLMPAAIAALLLLLLLAGRAEAAGWTAPVAISAEGGYAAEAALGTDAAGDQVAAWQQKEAGEWTLLAAVRPARGSWSTPEAISSPGSELGTPSVTVNASGEAAIAWADASASEAPAYVVHGDVTGDWGAPEAISTPGTTARNPQVGIDATGDLVATWREELPGYNFDTVVSSEEGGSWATPKVFPGTLSYDPADIAVNANGDAVLFWYRPTAVEVSSRPAGGSWGTPTLLASDGSSYIGHAKMALDAAGEAVAIWENDEGTKRLEASRMSPGGTWSAAESLPGVSQHWSYQPGLAITPSGEETAAWVNEDESGFETSSRTVLGSWSTPVTIQTPELEDAWEPWVEIDPAGIVTVVHSGWAAGHYAVGAARRSTDGTWEEDTLLNEAGEEPYGLRVDVDSTGGVTVAWSNYLSQTEQDIRSVELPGVPPVPPVPPASDGASTGTAVVAKTTSSPTPIVCTALAGVVAAEGYVPATTKPGKTVPGVRARISVPTPSKAGVEATFTYTGHAVAGGTYSMSMAKSGNLRVPVPGSLRAKLPLGSKVAVSLRIVTTPKGSSPCAAPVTTTKKLTLKVVRVLSGAR